jgi:hypothetical protein
MDNEIVDRILSDDDPDSPRIDGSIRTELRPASAVIWVVLAFWAAIALYQFVEGEIVYGILLVLVGLVRASIGLD